MSWKELRKEAVKLSVNDRLALVDAIVQSLMHELEPRPKVAKGTLTGLRGLLKQDGVALTDEEVNVMLEERLEEKYK